MPMQFTDLSTHAATSRSIRQAPPGSCPVCGSAWKPNQVVNRTFERCHGCNQDIAHGKGCRRCSGQPCHMRCTACASAPIQQQHTTTPVQHVDFASQFPRDDHCRAALSQVPLADLLPQLCQLPAVWPMQPTHWVPRAHRSMAGQILCRILEAATVALTSEAGNAEAEAATLLCRNIGMILFRLPPASVDTETAAPGIAAEVRRRLASAAAGDWHSLLQDCLDELEMIPSKPAAEVTQSAPQPDAPLDDQTLARAAAKARIGGLRSAANILIGGPRVPAGPETDSKVRALFKMTEHTTPEDAERLRHAADMIRHLPAKSKPHIRPRAASLVAGKLRGSAGPGPSGFRNSFIQLVNAQPQGPRILAEWALPWMQGTVQPSIATYWTHQLCRPFFKTDAVGIRPVMCGEALYKYAAACAVFSATRSILAALGQSQYGAGRSGGASLQLAEIIAETCADPDDAIASLDVKNAFGSISWSGALHIAATTAPASSAYGHRGQTAMPGPLRMRAEALSKAGQRRTWFSALSWQ